MDGHLHVYVNLRATSPQSVACHAPSARRPAQRWPKRAPQCRPSAAAASADQTAGRRRGARKSSGGGLLLCRIIDRHSAND